MAFWYNLEYVESNGRSLYSFKSLSGVNVVLVLELERIYDSKGDVEDHNLKWDLVESFSNPKRDTIDAFNEYTALEIFFVGIDSDLNKILRNKKTPKKKESFQTKSLNDILEDPDFKQEMKRMDWTLELIKK